MFYISSNRSVCEPLLIGAFEVQGEKGVTRITDLKFVCFYCHGCEHFGWLENVFARLPSAREDVVSIAIDHYCEVNGVGPEEFTADEQAA